MSINLKSEKYSWGSILVISKGASYKAILHDDHILNTKKVINNIIPEYTFIDEQKYKWKVTKNNNEIIFKANNNKEIHVNINDFLDSLSK
jgi:cbb3-type cytochrome oxidase cytochrome c subunit